MASKITDTDRPNVGDEEPSAQPLDAPVAQPLKLLEARVNEVQSRWHAVEQQLGEKDRTIADLRIDLDARAAVIKRLEATLDEAVAARDFAQDANAATQAELSYLEGQLQQQSDLLSSYQEQLSAATGEYQLLQDELGNAYGEIQELRSDLEQEPDSGEIVDRGGAELSAGREAVARAVTDLEPYLQERKRGQSQQQDELAQHADSPDRLQQRTAEQAALLDAERENGARLDAQNKVLESRCADREATIAVLQHKLAGRMAEIEAAREETAGVQAQLGELEDTMAVQVKEIQQLRGGIAQRDDAIQGLEEALDGETRLTTELKAQLEEQSARVRAAEAKLADKMDETRALELQLAGLRDRVSEAEADLAQRTAEVGALEGTAQRTAETLAATTGNLEQATREAEALKGELRAARALNQELEELVSTTQVDRRVFEAELGAQQLLINELEQDLARQQQTVGRLDSSVARIAKIAASLETLDRQMASSTPAPSEEHLVPAAASGPKPFVVMEGKRYPLDKPVITLGRSRTNDVHLQSMFASRFHARLLVEPSGEVTIEDLASRNGVRVNAEKVSRQVLQHRDKIWIGERELVFFAPEAATGAHDS
jgi:chromosome segregation ATPase